MIWDACGARCLRHLHDAEQPTHDTFTASRLALETIGVHDARRRLVPSLSGRYAQSCGFLRT